MIDLNGFANKIWSTLYQNMPVSKSLTNPSGSKKHKDREGHMRDFALGKTPSATMLPNGSYVFEIGNQLAEENYPHYHILEDSEVIAKRNRGTQKSKGSQDTLAKKDRDYSRVTRRISVNKQTGEVRTDSKGNVKYNYYQEYRKNVRGKRSLIGKARAGDKTYRYYPNKHYHYIENILDRTLAFIGQDFGLKLQARTIDTGLQDEANYQDTLDMEGLRSLIDNIFANGGINYFGNNN